MVQFFLQGPFYNNTGYKMANTRSMDDVREMNAEEVVSLLDLNGIHVESAVRDLYTFVILLYTFIS